MQAEYLFVHQRCQRQPTKQLIGSLPNNLPVVWTKSLAALRFEAKVGVDLRVFVISADKKDTLRVANLQAQQQHYDLNISLLNRRGRYETRYQAGIRASSPAEGPKSNGGGQLVQGPYLQRP